MNAYMLRSGDIWLSEAVELAASRLFSDAWQSSEQHADEKTALQKYRSALERFEAGGGFATSLGSIFSSANQAYDSPPPRPNITPLAEFAETKERLRQAVIESAWGKIRQALVDGALTGHSFFEIEEHAAVPAATWGKPQNAKCHLSGRRVYFGRANIGNGLRGGRPYLSKRALEDFLQGSFRDDGDTDTPNETNSTPPIVGLNAINDQDKQRSSPRSDLAKELVARAYPNGVNETDRTVEVIRRALREYRKEDGIIPSGDAIKRVIGRKKR